MKEIVDYIMTSYNGKRKHLSITGLVIVGFILLWQIGLIPCVIARIKNDFKQDDKIIDLDKRISSIETGVIKPLERIERKLGTFPR